MDSLYSIMDTKQSRYGSLMTYANDNDAIRAFQTMLTLNEDSSMLSLYPTDYCLFVLGQFDKETGTLAPCQPQLIITGYDAVVRAIDEVNRRKKLQKALRDGTLEPDSGSSVPDVDKIEIEK